MKKSESIQREINDSQKKLEQHRAKALLISQRIDALNKDRHQHLLSLADGNESSQKDLDGIDAESSKLSRQHADTLTVIGLIEQKIGKLEQELKTAIENEKREALARLFSVLEDKYPKASSALDKAAAVLNEVWEDLQKVDESATQLDQRFNNHGGMCVSKIVGSMLFFDVLVPKLESIFKANSLPTTRPSYLPLFDEYIHTMAKELGL